MAEAQFIEKVSVEQAKKYMQEGRKPYQFLTRNPAALPIFGPAYDLSGSLNVAKREGRYALTLQEAQASAKRLKTEIVEVFFLTQSA
jgi:hypothetical protein